MIGKVVGTEYIETVTVEKRLVNTDVAAEKEHLQKQKAEWQSQIAHLTACIAANDAKIAEYTAALGLLPKIEVVEEPIDIEKVGL